MNIAQHCNWLYAQWLMEIWNPDKLPWNTNTGETIRSKLLYRARGIILHDRALNGEI